MQIEKQQEGLILLLGNSGRIEVVYEKDRQLSAAERKIMRDFARKAEEDPDDAFQIWQGAKENAKKNKTGAIIYKNTEITLKEPENEDAFLEVKIHGLSGWKERVLLKNHTNFKAYMEQKKFWRVKKQKTDDEFLQTISQHILEQKKDPELLFWLYTELFEPEFTPPQSANVLGFIENGQFKPWLVFPENKNIRTAEEKELWQEFCIQEMKKILKKIIKVEKSENGAKGTLFVYENEKVLNNI